MSIAFYISYKKHLFFSSRNADLHRSREKGVPCGTPFLFILHSASSYEDKPQFSSERMRLFYHISAEHYALEHDIVGRIDLAVGIDIRAELLQIIQRKCTEHGTLAHDIIR